MAGDQGKSLFLKDVIHETKVGIVEFKNISIDTMRGFNAQASAWGLISAGAGTTSTTRYASYRAYNISSVLEIDDATAMRVAPKGAGYYLWRLHMGHSFEMVVSGDAGDERTFTASVKASFFGAGGGISAFAQSHNLQTTAFGRGLDPTNGQALFAKTADEIESSYTMSGDPVPVFAEYRSIPGACLAPDSDIKWKDPMHMRVSYNKLYVYNDGSFGADTWSMSPKCTLNDQEVPLLDMDAFPRQSVSDDCTGGIRGPNGDGDYCSYDMFWTTVLDVIEDDDVRCGVNGTEWDKGHNIPFSQFRYTVQAADANKPVSDKFGTAGEGMEYWLFYSLEFPK
jgi:hypothetical protein